MTQFNNRVFGAAIVKAINSNYNADFSGQPRTLPDGRVYATDKAYKYTIKNYLKDMNQDDLIFYFKTIKKETLNPRDLNEQFEALFPNDKATKDKKIVLKNLLSCIDIRLFGATYANKAKKIALSIHGPVQVNHGVNIWREANIYSEQILSPFADTKKDKKGKDKEAEASTLGSQSKLEEGHYLHHFSINPKNLNEIASLAGTGAKVLSTDDIAKLKEGMTKGATYYDSASKAGTENEFLIWLTLKEESKLVLPSFLQLIKMEEEKKDNKVVLDLGGLNKILERYEKEIESIEIYRNSASIIIENVPKNAIIHELF